LEAAAQVWVSHTGERRHGAGRRAIEPLALVAEHLGCRTPVVKVELPFGMLSYFLIHPQNLTVDHSLERGRLVSVKDYGLGHVLALLRSAGRNQSGRGRLTGLAK
jgi:hypothetical protein